MAESNKRIAVPEGSVGGPPWPALAFPAAALALLILVEAQGWNQAGFSWGNGLSAFTGPRFWAAVTLFGDGLVCAVLLLPVLQRHPKRVWGGLLGTLVAWLILRFFKGTYGLPRPPAVLSPDEITIIGTTLRRSAFPSGHTMTAFLLAGAVTLNARKRWLPWLGLAFASFVGISRMAVGVHWPSDILAGAALGWTGAWLGLRWADRWVWTASPSAQRVLTVLLLACALWLLFLYSSGYPDTVWLQRGLALGCLVVGGRGLVANRPLRH